MYASAELKEIIIFATMWTVDWIERFKKIALVNTKSHTLCWVQEETCGTRRLNGAHSLRLRYYYYSGLYETRFIVT